MTSYQKAVWRLPRRIQRELSFPAERFLPLHGDPGDDAELRPAREVAERAIVLRALLAALEGDEREAARAWLARELPEQSITPKERPFFEPTALTPQQVIRGSWQVERLKVLCWALGLVPELGVPGEQCETDAILATLPPVGGCTASLLKGASLRPTADILDQLGILFHIRCRLVQAAIQTSSRRFPAGKLSIVRVERLPRRLAPGGLDEEVALEWHRALNWLAGYVDEEWDEISVDT